LKFLSVLNCLIDSSNHEKGLFRNGVVLARNDFFEALDRILNFDITTFSPSKLLGDEERLSQETLNLSGSGNGQFIFV
jgi:hypothetical protein